MRKILLLIFIPLITYCQSPDSLVGVWQDNENLGSGWSNTFLFFSDGSYKFFASQMDCSKRHVSSSGKWKISGIEDAIILTTESKVIIEGGKMEKSDGSCASDSMLSGGEQKIVAVYPREISDYSLSKVYKDESGGISRKFIYIDAMKYWYFGSPSEMLNQFEK